MKKNNLDERQELKLLQVEHNAMWLAFWALVVAIVVQLMLDYDDIKPVLGECFVLVLISIYIVYGCIKNGIWDRKLKPDHRTNVIASVIAGVAVALINVVVSYVRYKNIANTIASATVNFLFTSILCFIVLTIISGIYKKRVKDLDDDIQE